MLAEIIYVVFGFGAGLIVVGTLALVLPNIQDVVVLLLLVNLPAELLVVTRSRNNIRWPGVLRICIGLAVGVPLGAWALTQWEPLFLLTLLGIFLVLVSSAFLLVPNKTRVNWPTWTTPPVGLVSGILSGLFGTGGPPLILYYQLAGVAKATFRGNLMAIFLIVGIARIPVYAVAGLMTAPRLLSCLVILPAVLVGALIGHRVHLTMDEATFRRGVSIALLVIGVILLLRHLSF